VGSDPSLINPWPTETPIIYFYEYFLPVFTCPYTTQRIGKMGDGGKFVCGFELFETPTGTDLQGLVEPEPCILYSFGVSGDSSFEAEFFERTNCEIHGFDASTNKMGPQISGNHQRVRFYKIFIGDKDDYWKSTKTLGTIMRENGHTWIDVLKMDIEANEYAVLNQIMDEFPDELPFGQLQVEIHAEGEDERKEFAKVYNLWERLEKVGMRAFMNEVNHNPCIVRKNKPVLMEYSFINIKADHRIVV
jgi:hypothetical protein